MRLFTHLLIGVAAVLLLTGGPLESPWYRPILVAGGLLVGYLAFQAGAR